MAKLRMRFKALIIPIVVLTGIAILAYWSGWWIISSKWKTEFTSDQISEWTAEIRGTPSPPDNFLSVFMALQPHGKKNTIKKLYPDYLFEVVSGFWPRRPWGNRVYSLRASDLLLNGEYDRNPSMLERSFVLACGLEKFVSQEECLNYFLGNVVIHYPISSDTLLRVEGIEGIAQFKFNKKVAQLSDDEILEVIIAFDENNKQLGRFYNPELFEKRLEALKQVVERNRTKQ